MKKLHDHANIKVLIHSVQNLVEFLVIFIFKTSFCFYIINEYKNFHMNKEKATQHNIKMRFYCIPENHIVYCLGISYTTFRVLALSVLHKSWLFVTTFFSIKLYWIVAIINA